MSADIWGSVGVGLLLIAFVLNLLRRLSEQSPTYLLMNLVGAGMSAWYAVAGGMWPFVVLEGTWAAAALIRLGIVLKKSPQS
jgi:hypothetical protein